MILRIRDVDFAAQQWVNGQLAATHGGRHTDTVCAEDDAHDPATTRGEQY